MKRLLASCAFITLIIAAAPAFPLGFGIYGTGGGGRSDSLLKDYSVDYSFNHYSYGGGILFESGDEDSSFHNRTSIQVQPYEAQSPKNSYRKLLEFGLEHTWAFGIASNDRVRFWIGPGAGMQLITGRVKTYRRKEWSRDQKDNFTLLAVANPAASLPMVWYLNYDPVWKRTTGSLLYLTGALGVNVALGRTAWFFVEAGARVGYQYLSTHAFAYEGYGKIGFIFGRI